jgi:prepilin-type N-terminal cleavage/methylation domain-containing protein/prepilin-type processing-associated H-X9-DG protein
MLTRSCRKKAFTLVELLVVIAIIGILIALLLPAVQAAREAARRAQCTNNAKQLVLAMHNYHDVHKMLPITYGGNAQYNNTNTGHSWMTGILPFVEQQPLYDKIDFGLPVGSGNPGDATYNVNTEVSRTVVAAFLCPSDSNDEGLVGGRANVGDTRAVNNYKACAGSNWGWGDAVCRFIEPGGRWSNDANGLDHGNGIICRNGGNDTRNWTRFRDIEDGTSNTFAVGEAVPKWCIHTWWWWFNGSTATCGTPLNYVSDAIRADPANRTLETQAGDWGNNYSFMSRHPGGGNFGICDGSVKFVSETIDLMTYRHLASIADRVPVQVP